jgi:predicted permease
MRHLSDFKNVLRNLFLKKRAENELDSELRAYVEIVTDERVASGMSRSEARRTALADFGGLEQVKQAVRDRRGGSWLELLWGDLRYGFRRLIRNPGFTFTVVSTLGLSIGANTAVFSLVNALILRSLPYGHPERIGTIFWNIQGPRPFDGPHQITGREWELLRDDVSSLTSAVSSRGTSGANLLAGKHVQYVYAGRVSAHYLDVLDLHPVLGRNFSEAEDRPHGPKAVILSYGLWHSTFGEDRGLLGRTIHLKGDSYTVIGVLPRLATTPLNADLYTSLQPSLDGEGGGSNYAPYVRLRAGASWQQADAQVNRALSDTAQQRAKIDGPGTRVSFYTLPLQKGEAAAIRPQVLTLMSASGFILMIACANLAGLTLVRMARRAPEIATRLALGGSQWQVERQLWIENLVVALIGGAAGIGIGFLALRGLLALLPARYLPVADVHLDGAVLAFTLALSVLTSLLFGMLPAFAVRRVNLRSSMSRRRIAGTERTHVRQVLIAGEVALTVVLLAGCGLLIRTLIHLQTLPPGFNPRDVMAAKASLDDARYHDPAAFHRLLEESTAAMQRIPGVENAGVGLSLPYESVLNDTVTLGDGKETGQQVETDMLYVTPGYLATLQIPILAGRGFNASDGADTQRVAIVNRTFARKFYNAANPVGRTLRSGPTSAVIVGEVGDVELVSLLNPVAPLQTEQTVYLPAAQITSANNLALLHTWFQPAWIVRTSGQVEGLTAQMQQALASVDPSLPYSGFYSMSDLQAQTLATQRVQVALLGTMAGLALLLSAVGIFALVANSVAERAREIGIRIALGSTLVRAMSHVAGIGIRPAAIGLALGLIGCFLALPALRSVLFGVGVYDASSIGGVVGVLTGVTALATVLPALRIATIDPGRTLREE